MDGCRRGIFVIIQLLEETDDLKTVLGVKNKSQQKE